MELLKFGAIDIGSNAARLLISEVTEREGKPFFKKNSLVRVPLRLGADAFVKKKISSDRIEMMMNAMHAYAHLLKAHNVLSYRACATSAMREAQNRASIIQRIKKETGIEIEIISGSSEAEILYATQITEKLENNRPYLYIDVGGGSTEISFFYNNQVIASKSFKIGTLRILNGQVKTENWGIMKKWLRDHAVNFNNLGGIGTGGNINKLFKVCGTRVGEAIPLSKLEYSYKTLGKMTVKQRIHAYNMRQDRADVVVPANEIFCNVLKWANCKEIFVPKVGLSDGIVRLLYKDYHGK